MSYCTEGSVAAIGILFPTLGATAVAARFYARERRRTSFMVDDWMCIPALVTVAAAGIAMAVGAFQDVIGARSSFGGQASVVDTENKQIAIEKYQTGLNPTTIVATALIKISILLFYRRIFRGKVFDILNWGMIVFMALYGISLPVAYLSACGSHFSYQWGTLEQLKGNCVNTFAILMVANILNFASDLVVWTMPLFWLSKLQMSMERKIASGSVFLVGILALAASALKMVLGIYVYSYQPGSDSTILGISTEDNIGLISVSLFWSYLEVGVGMVVACLPSLRVLMDNSAFNRIHDSTKRLLMSLTSNTNTGASKGNKEYRSSESTHDRNSSKSPSRNKTSDSDFLFSQGSTSTYVNGQKDMELGDRSNGYRS